MSNISRLFFALVCIVFGYCLHSWLYNYQSNKYPTADVPNYALMRRLDAATKLADSLHLQNAYLTGWKEETAKILWTYQHKPPRIKTATDRVTILAYDTVRSVVNITDTFRKSAYIATVEPDAMPSLKLPAAFKLADTYLELYGRIDTTGVSLDTISIFNTIAIKDTPKKTLFREYHSVTFAQSNPYIASVTPIYTYSKPTNATKWFNRIIGFGLGFGTAYGLQQFKK